MSKSTQHDLVAMVLELAQRLDRTPTWLEFAQVEGVVDYQVRRQFGNFSSLLEAAGLTPYKKRRRPPLPSTIFECDVVKHVEEHKSLERPALEFPSAAIISDIHWPFSSERVIEKFYKYVERAQPAHVILAGDAWDMYSWAKYPRSHNIFVPEEEEKLARKMNEEFWREVQKLAPRAQCTQMLGNHDARPLKRTLEVQPTIEHWVKKIFGALFTFENVRTMLDPREEFFLDKNTLVHHGYLGKLGDHRDHSHYNVVCGHTHKGGVVFREIRGQILWELNCGYAGDPLAKGLTYTPQRITGWTPGFGAIDGDGPRFICA